MELRAGTATGALAFIDKLIVDAIVNRPCEGVEVKRFLRAVQFSPPGRAALRRPLFEAWMGCPRLVPEQA